ncbi:MAG: ABC transporter substrate-binding protein [Pseudobdellovibrionaceae bacterium]
MKHIFFVFSFLLLSRFAYSANITLALNWKAEPEFGGFYTAALQGIYKKYGLDVKIQEGGSGTPTIQMLANDKVDFAIVSADEIILSQDKNKQNKVKALFAVYQTAPYIIMTHAEKKFKNLNEVFTSAGTLSVQSGLPYYQFLVSKFGKANIKPKIVPYLGGVSHFLNDPNFSQQGFITSEPISAEKSGAKTKSFLVADEGFNPYVVVVATTEATMKKNPKLVREFVTAVREGWEQYLKAPQSTNEFMATLNKSLDLETFKKSADVQKPLIEIHGEKLGAMTKNRWQQLLDQMKSLGLTMTPLQADDLFVNY